MKYVIISALLLQSELLKVANTQLITVNSSQGLSVEDFLPSSFLL